MTKKATTILVLLLFVFQYGEVAALLPRPAEPSRSAASCGCAARICCCQVDKASDMCKAPAQQPQQHKDAPGPAFAKCAGDLNTAVSPASKSFLAHYLQFNLVPGPRTLESLSMAEGSGELLVLDSIYHPPRS